MTSYREHLYHPFTNSSFGIFFTDHKLSRDEHFGVMLESIDLYYQPLQPPLIAIIFLLVRTSIVIIGEWMHTKVYKAMKKDNSLVNEVAALYISVQMVYVPVWLLFTTCTDFIHPIDIVIGKWFCTFGWFFIYFCATTLAIHSFIVALMRYFFIVHKEKVESFGIKKARKIFLILNVLIPVLIVLLMQTQGSDTEAFSFINKCYGRDHRRFLTDLSPSDVFQSSFCMLEKYEDVGSFGKLVGILRRGSCIGIKILYIFLGFNITEGILYYKILLQLNRYKTNSIY